MLGNTYFRTKKPSALPKYIGFTLQRKNISLQKIVGLSYNTNTDIIPVQSWIRTIRVSLGLFKEMWQSSVE